MDKVKAFIAVIADFFPDATPDDWVLILLGTLAHIVLKSLYDYNKYKKSNEPFHRTNYIIENGAFYILGIIGTLAAAILVPAGSNFGWILFLVTIGGSSALYNLYPILSNAEMWKSIFGTLIERLKPKP